MPGQHEITHLETKIIKLSACISMLQFTARSLYFHDTVMGQYQAGFKH